MNPPHCRTPESFAIYDHYVRDTAVSFEYETPTEEFRGQMENILWRYPYLVVWRGGRSMRRWRRHCGGWAC